MAIPILMLLLFVSFSLYVYFIYKFHTTEIIIISPEQNVSFKKKSLNSKGISIFGSDKLLYNALDSKILDQNIDIYKNFDPQKPLNLGYASESEDMHLEDKIFSKDIEIIIDDTFDNRKLFQAMRPELPGYWIRLGVVKNKQDGAIAWQKMQVENMDILSGLNLRFEKISNKNDQIFYYMIAGNFKIFHKAKTACAKLRARSQECMVHSALHLHH